MNKVKIITDSCCSLSIHELNNMGIDFLPMTIVIDENDYVANEHPIQNPEEFYNELKKANSCSTSCINENAFYEKFLDYVKSGYDVFYIGLSSGLSSTYNNAVNAANSINKAFGKRVFIADSLAGSFGIAIMLEKAFSMVKEGKTAQEILFALDKNKMNIANIFAPSDLQFLIRSGRISRLVGNIGSMLKISPIMCADENGKLKMIAKCIGRKKAISTIENYILQNLNNNLNQTIYIGHTNQKEEAESISNFILSNTQIKNVKIGYIDYTMGCCCGPETIAIFFEKNKNN